MLALNPLIAGELDSSKNAPIVETYSVARPEAAASGQVYDKIVEVSKKYGVNTDTALRIASCESNLRQFNGETVIRGKVNPKDVGVFQINEDYHLNRSGNLDFNIYQTDGNIEYAMWLMKQEGNRHWNWSKPCWSQIDKNA